MAAFMNNEHEERYNEVLGRMKRKDTYHKAAAYLITLDEELYNHIDEVFDFDKGSIFVSGLAMRGWQTAGSIKTTHLLLNLWNSSMADFDRNDKIDKDSIRQYSVDEIFSSNLAYWYFEAIKLRYPHIERSVS